MYSHLHTSKWSRHGLSVYKSLSSLFKNDICSFCTMLRIIPYHKTSKLYQNEYLAALIVLPHRVLSQKEKYTPCRKNNWTVSWFTLVWIFPFYPLIKHAVLSWDSDIKTFFFLFIILLINIILCQHFQAILFILMQFICCTELLDN